VSGHFAHSAWQVRALEDRLHEERTRLDFLLEDDPRFRRRADNLWTYEAADGTLYAGPTARAAIDAALRAQPPLAP
jgi:hypothetical protein